MSHDPTCLDCAWCNADPTTHLAMLAALWEAAADKESVPWDEVEEQRLDAAADRAQTDQLFTKAGM